MLEFPSTPSIAAADGKVLSEGHLWLLEHVEGEPLRFRVLPSGLIEFGTRDRIVDDPDRLPPGYRHATFHVRDHLDRDGLRAALDDPGAVTFFGIATQRGEVAYNWTELPSFLGVDVQAADRTPTIR